MDCVTRQGLEVTGILKSTEYIPHRPASAFDFHHPLEPKLGVIRTLQHWAETVTPNTKSKDKQCSHLRSSFKVFGNPDLDFIKTSTKGQKNNRTIEQRGEAEHVR